MQFANDEVEFHASLIHRQYHNPTYSSVVYFLLLSSKKPSVPEGCLHWPNINACLIDFQMTGSKFFVLPPVLVSSWPDRGSNQTEFLLLLQRVR